VHKVLPYWVCGAIHKLMVEGYLEGEVCGLSDEGIALQNNS
jgi:hypothetical protein